MCGENTILPRRRYARRGSPPRVRGKHRFITNVREANRITPACAGKTYFLESQGLPVRDHPRVCGENPIGPTLKRLLVGSPPRVRGKLEALPLPHEGRRITPACAGKTISLSTSGASGRDHPRVCGENGVTFQLRDSLKGSPPRVRGKLWSTLPDESWTGITPACAGKTFAVEVWQY